MAPGRQASLTQAGWEGRTRRTRRAGLPGQTGSVVPWAEAAGPGRAAGDGRGQARQAALARRGAARDAPRAVPAGPDGRRLRGRLPRLALGPRPRGVPVPRARRHDSRGLPPPPGGERRREGPARRRGRPPRGGRTGRARRLGGRRHGHGGARPARGRVGLARPRDAPGQEGQPVAPRHEVPPGEGRRRRPRRRDLAGRTPGARRSARTRTPPGPAGASRWAPPSPGPHGGPGGTGAGRGGAEASVRARASAPARSPGAPSATRGCATAASRGGRVRVPALPASANLPVCARAGRQGEFLGASVAAARRRPRGQVCRERGPGRPGRPQRSEHDQKSTDCQGF